MSDEQTIYISPEDDLTSIRERLKNVDAKNVTLVIPSNTQLRGHVAWKVLYVRVRELGKEVLIVSSDPQIRSVAHAVKFRVATSLEASSQAGKPRPPSRPGRAGRSRTAGLSSSRSSSSATRSPAELRGVQGMPNPASSSRSTSLRPSQQLSTQAEERTARPEPGSQRQRSKRSQADEMIIEDVDQSTPIPRSPDTPFEYRINSIPPIHPLPAEQLDEEPDLWLEDYEQAQHIREAALGNANPEQGIQPKAPPETPFVEQPSQRSFEPLPRVEDDDPFAYMDDALPPPAMQEQRGSASLEHFDTNEHVIQDVPDLPTQMIEGEVEDDDNSGPGGMGTYDVHPHSSNPHSASGEHLAGPTGVYGVRPHGSNPRVSKRRRSSRSLDEQPPITPAIEDEPTRTMPPQTPSSARRSAPLKQPPSRRSAPLQEQPSARRSSPLQQPSRRSVPLQGQSASRRSGPLDQPSARRSVPLQGRDRSVISGSLSPRPASRKGPASSRSAVPQGRTTYAIIAAIILLVIIIGLLATFAPSANVTLALQSHTYAHALTLVAKPGAPANVVGVVPAHLQTHTFMQNGTAIATGTKKVGKNPATGTVTFTNTGKHSVIIPTGTLVSTASGIQFATQAELSVDVPGNPGNSVPVPVKAQVLGDTGNVAAGAIGVIPQNSLNAIAKNDNMTASDLALKVTNSQPTTGGGLGTAHTISQQDLSAAMHSMNTKVQPNIEGWLKQISITDVSSQPNTQSQLVNPPQNGQIVNNTTVPITLKVIVSVLVVHSNELQNAAVVQLNQLLRSDRRYSNYAVLNAAQHPLVLKQTANPRGDTKSLTFSDNATAQITPNIDATTVRNQVVGQSLAGAHKRLAQLPGVQRADIQVSPSFISWVPFWTPNIKVQLQAEAAH
ncbi:MAG TPA: baseplate J/gp47 family protein [Ktedonobacteraceae bacterium]|nr:baseplate J/gp47 family protein [Ktedonobacteraceae bacterium]